MLASKGYMVLASRWRNPERLGVNYLKIRLDYRKVLEFGT